MSRREFLTFPFVGRPAVSAADAEAARFSGRIPLSTLGEIPESVLMRMRPVLRKGCAVRKMDNVISFVNESGQAGNLVMTVEEWDASLLFDGVRTLAQVAIALAERNGIPPAQGRTVARSAFLALADCGIYHPNGPPVPEDPETGDGASA